MIAPLTMRRPAGAVRPAIKPTIGLLRPRFASSAMNCAAPSAAPDLADQDDRLVSGRRGHFEDLDKIESFHGSPPMPTAVVGRDLRAWFETPLH